MISLDIETCGLNPSIHDMLSIGATHIESGEEFYLENKIDIHTPVSEKAIQVNGFSRKELYKASKPTPMEALEAFIQWTKQYVPENQRILIGWNLPSFDVQFLKYYHDTYNYALPKWVYGHRYCDLHSMAYLLLGKSITSIQACDVFDVKPEAEPHNALGGARMNVRLWNAMRKRVHDHGTEEIERFILTYTGEKFHFPNPKPESVNINDIAHGLSQTCRFAGQGNGFYSVAMHSVIVTLMVKQNGGTRDEQLQALLHDASEAYLADVPGPAKIFLPDYQVMEKKVAAAIGKAFDIDLINICPIVEWADRQNLWWEAQHLFNNPNWVGEVEEFLEDRTLVDYTYHKTEHLFLELFDDIYGSPSTS